MAQSTPMVPAVIPSPTRKLCASSQQTSRPTLASQTCHQHPHGPLAHVIRPQGSEFTRITIDPVRGQTVRRRAGGEEEMALRVEAEGAGYRFGRHVPDGRQPPGGDVYCEARDAVVASVWRVQECP